MFHKSIVLAGVLLTIAALSSCNAGDFASQMANGFENALDLGNGSSGGGSSQGGSSGGSKGGSSGGNGGGGGTFVISTEQGTRPNTSVVKTPSHPGTNCKGNDVVSIDLSEASHGYVTAHYTGSVIGEGRIVKFRITGSDGVTYTYILSGGYDVFPLSDGSDTYTFEVYEQIEGKEYIKCFTVSEALSVTNEFDAWLYPNQYAYFTSDSAVVKKAEELAFSANSDLDVLTNVYNFIITNITYDYNKAETVASGYVPDVDSILASKTGICLDYASVMCSMLRSQGIPTRLEVGYVDGNVYHAWVSVYLKEIGWVNGIVEFDGKTWKLMDPTFASNMKESNLKKYIGNGSNYQTKYIY